jgi:hypothetical protein
MAQFEARGAKATFLVTGNNIGKGYIDENWADVISKMTPMAIRSPVTPGLTRTSI